MTPAPEVRLTKSSPSLMYKYQSINNNSLAGLESGTFYYAGVEKFNDPFELVTHPDICSDAFADNYREYEGFSPNLSSQQCREAFQNNWREFSKDVGVVSLSRRRDILLMWAHYASDHSGMCLEFEFSTISEFYPVRYSNSLPVAAKVARGSWIPQAFSELLTVKHTGWQYEKEMRLISVGANRSISYPKHCKLTGVTFGTKTSQNDVRLVRSVLAGKQVKFSRAKLSDDSYALEFEDDKMESDGEE